MLLDEAKQILKKNGYIVEDLEWGTKPRFYSAKHEPEEEIDIGKEVKKALKKLYNEDISWKFKVTDQREDFIEIQGKRAEHIDYSIPDEILLTWYIEDGDVYIEFYGMGEDDDYPSDKKFNVFDVPSLIDVIKECMEID